MTRPIPLQLLIHTVEYHQYNGNSTWGEAYKAPVMLYNVLVQSIPSYRRKIGTSEREQENNSSILFFDAVHSYPKVNWQEKSKIVLNGTTYYVANVDEFYGFGTTPHHWEVTLV
ncbi:minor capsid protein [Ectobacillus sp. JY-23]|jgi:hypothetical protein|uniref:putative minor capsid protein n=1 Tax=Ectobacillus sp. JY-23 TaxID=2933872 RepID=UPI001FF10CB5|nr:putative minor capsid protein [Ectobacillus sp. JY-23]UOY92896.1 minor capsid protein [Ectobacillus sp. JY-23]